MEKNKIREMFQGVVGKVVNSICFDKGFISFKQNDVEIRASRELAISTNQQNRLFENVIIDSDENGLNIASLKHIAEKRDIFKSTYHNGLLREKYLSSLTSSDIRREVLGGAYICHDTDSSSQILGLLLKLVGDMRIFIEPYDSNWNYLQVNIRKSTDMDIYIKNFLTNYDLDESSIYRLE